MFAYNYGYIIGPSSFLLTWLVTNRIRAGLVLRMVIANTSRLITTTLLPTTSWPWKPIFVWLVVRLELLAWVLCCNYSQERTSYSKGGIFDRATSQLVCYGEPPYIFGVNWARWICMSNFVDKVTLLRWWLSLYAVVSFFFCHLAETQCWPLAGTQLRECAWFPAVVTLPSKLLDSVF